jgi:membrane fusion protein (multidrug efflux system)
MRTRAEAESRRAEVEALKMSIAAAEAAVARREEALELRHIRAPVDGRIGWLALLDIGNVVREGDHLFSVVPDGPVRAMAEFLPSALGRLRPGLPARVRLDGFPWIQYGSVAATVESVGSEARDGRVRVELVIDPAASTRIPLEHGLTGTIEVAVEQAAPAVLVVRAIGRWLTPAKPPVQVTADR